MSKQIYVNKYEPDRISMNNKIDRNLVNKIDEIKTGLQILVRNETITKADIVESIIKFALDSEEKAIQIDENLYSYKELLELLYEFKECGKKFMCLCNEGLCNYIFIGHCIEEVRENINEDYNENNDCNIYIDNINVRDNEEDIIDSIVSSFRNNFEINEKYKKYKKFIDIMQVSNLIDPNFEKKLNKKILLAAEYVNDDMNEKSKKEVAKIIKNLPEELNGFIKDEDIKNYLLKFIVLEFSETAFKEKGICLLGDIFDCRSTDEDITKVFKEQTKKDFYEFLKNAIDKNILKLLKEGE